MKKIMIIMAYATASFPLTGMSPKWIRTVPIDQIAKKIWFNECSGKKEGLVSWNEGEEFASLGIGHFIWYPKDKKKLFLESFPDLLAFLEQHGYTLPRWLTDAKHTGCPWKNRQQLLNDANTMRTKQLQTMLEKTVVLQTQFILKRVERFEQQLKEEPRYAYARTQLKRLLTTPEGVYAIIDYLNFKGEGFNTHEAYHGHGWGLLHVLKQMKGKGSGLFALKEFCTQAKRLLKRRTELAPPHRKEERWILGWYNRIDGYLT